MLQHIRESNLIEGFNSRTADDLGLVAWRELLACSRITNHSIWLIQRIITIHQDDLADRHRGHYRDIQIRIGDRLGTDPSLIAGMMGNWVMDMENYQKLDPKEMHIRFEKIHPFADGNGRTGRMLMWWHEKKLKREPTLILDAEKEHYYKWFS